MSREGFNAVISVKCKYLKRVTLVSGENTWSAKKWAWVLLCRLKLIDLGLLAVWIFDKDPKFLSKLWAAFFTKFGVQQHNSTVYHPQIDSSSERTNQAVQIAFCSLVDSTPNVHEWPMLLFRVQFLLNKKSFSTTEKSPNEIVYGFTPKQPFNILMPMALVDQSEERSAASNVIKFALMAHKNHYDRSHQSSFLKVGEYVSLHPYKGHSISSILRVTKNETQQYVRLFRVLKKVGRLVYCLNVSINWRIDPLFLVAQLEPAPPLSQDPF